MAKKQSKFICQNCGTFAGSWLGKCPDCGAWDSFVEEVVTTQKGLPVEQSEAVLLKDIHYDQSIRTTSGIAELDLVLGGGIVAGSLVLVGGDPGIGKSTMLLQVANHLAASKKVLYVSGEESLAQIKLRAERVAEQLNDLLLLAENEISSVLASVEKTKPALLIVDSIQTMYDQNISSAPGSVSQVREVTNKLLLLAKRRGIVVFIIGHVTKSGAIAGPKVLEHMVDTVLYFEGATHGVYRMLRAVKNRFGSTNEIGVFEMRNRGLVGVENPSKIFIDNKPAGASGSVVTACVEGTRPLLIEVQALTSVSNYASPRRLAVGVEYNRLTFLLAVLEKVVGLSLGGIDVYVNLVGGVNVGEPALDLAIVAAVVSSYRNRAIGEDVIIFGEVGLTGEVRGISNPEKRVIEATKMGYRKIVLPAINVGDIKCPPNVQLLGVKRISQAFEQLWQ